MIKMIFLNMTYSLQQVEKWMIKIGSLSLSLSHLSELDVWEHIHQ